MSKMKELKANRNHPCYIKEHEAPQPKKRGRAKGTTIAELIPLTEMGVQQLKAYALRRTFFADLLKYYNRHGGLTQKQYACFAEAIEKDNIARDALDKILGSLSDYGKDDPQNKKDTFTIPNFEYFADIRANEYAPFLNPDQPELRKQAPQINMFVAREGARSKAQANYLFRLSTAIGVDYYNVYLVEYPARTKQQKLFSIDCETGVIIPKSITRAGDINVAAFNALKEIMASPENAIITYGHMTGRCGLCNRTLTDPTSIALGIGPICAEKYSVDIAPTECEL